jgi:hypothetical protein
MSMDASGGFGGTLVFGKWKGRPTVRQLVTPANPNSSDQEDARNAIRVFGAIQHQMNLTTEKKGSETLTDKARLSAYAPSGQAWNGWLINQGVGKGAATYAAARAAYSALGSTPKSDYGSAAAGLTPPLPAVYQTVAGGGAGTSVPAGEVFFIMQYALTAALGDTAPGDTPASYA